MVFNNVNIQYQNLSNGPDAGRVYTIDHINSTLIVKTNPGGSVVNTIPLNTPIANEVLELEYDGFYFYTLSRLVGNNGVRISKWRLNLNNTLLIKVIGPGNEITLSDTASQTYSSEAFCIHRYSTTLALTAPPSTTTIELNDVTNLSLLDNIYLGPSTAANGLREAFTVIGISGNTVTLNAPTSNQYNLGDVVVYRKNIYLFNNFAGNNPVGGSLINLDQQTGNIVFNIQSNEWAEVTAASSLNGSLWFVRNSQLYRYNPIGANAGYSSSLLLKNTGINNRDTIKVFDIIITNNSVQKLQRERIIFNNTLDDFQIETGLNSRYHIDEEFLAPNFKSVSVRRNLDHILLGENKSSEFQVSVLDQYNTPIFARNLSVTEDNSAGFIESGFETIVTNVSGQGLTRYNSGLPVEPNVVNITIRDNITDLRGIFSIEQFDSINGVNFIEQRAELDGLVPLEQFTVSTSGFLSQESEVTSIGFLKQITDIDNKCFIEQFNIKKSILINQISPVTNTGFIDQKGLLEELTEVTQFVFLLFALPVPFSIKNPVDTNILIRIVGFGAIPLDTTTLSFKVNGIEVSDQVSIIPFGGGLQLEYDPSQNFNYGSSVSIDIEIKDLDTPANTIQVSYTFDTIQDYLAPKLVEVFPANNSELNTVDTIIYAIIEESETDLNLENIEFYVEGVLVPYSIDKLGNNKYQIIYSPECALPNDRDIDVNIRVFDLFDNKLEVTWDFKTVESSDVLFINNIPSSCSALVPVDSPVCVTALGQEDGIQINKSKLKINEQDVKFMLTAKVFRSK